MKLELPYFGKIDTNLEEDYEASILIEGKEVVISALFGEETIPEENIQFLKESLEQLPQIVEQAKKGLEENWKKEGEVKFYLDHHLEELEETEKEELLKNSNLDGSEEQKLYSLLSLVRIGFYPDDDESFIVLDFSIGEEVTQYLLVVNLNTEKEINYISMES